MPTTIRRNIDNEIVPLTSNESNKYMPTITSLDTSSLEENRAYTYKQLCTILNLPTLSGNAKPHQLQELQRWFYYEKVSTKYLIKEIYEVPLSYIPISSTSKYISDMVEIMLSYLYSSNEDVLYLKPSDIYLICGLTNQRYIKYNNKSKDSNDKKLSEYFNVSPTEIMYFFDRTDSYLKGIIKRSLDSMRNRNIIQYVETYVVCGKSLEDNEYELREATTFDRQCIMKVQNKVMGMFGIKSEGELYGVRRKERQGYYDALHIEMRKECPDWQYYYRTYKIYSSPDVLHQISSTSMHQRSLNLKVFNFLNDQAIKQYKEELKRRPPKAAKDWLNVQKQLADHLIKIDT